MSAVAASIPVSDAGTVPVVNRIMVIVAVMSATMMQMLDTTIVNVALPQMQGQLEAERARADQGEAQCRQTAEELRHWRARAEELDRRRLSQRLRRVWRRLRGVVTRPPAR